MEALQTLKNTEGPHNQAIDYWDKGLVIWEGLRFRSTEEVQIAKALDRLGVMFLPNCKGRVGKVTERKSEEADFVVFYEGKVGVLEIDGSQHSGYAAKDHTKDRYFLHSGVKLVQRYEAKRCRNDAESVVADFLALLSR